jgi:hypothetical protein
MKKPAFFKLTEAEQITLLVVTIDPFCMRRFNPGDCLPRGYEMHGHEKVNEMQEFRQRTATRSAHTILKVITA